ncbi:MAG: methyl-accepting chemotaxis protein, partial [Rhodoferax sp.]|nr:methyl-accepting chemotaxis protein [Rhodoferax sp.]
MQFSNLRIRTRLSIAFGGLTLMVLLVSGVALFSLADANARFAGYTAGLNARATVASHVRTAVDERAIAARNVVLVTKDTDRASENAAAVA